jgi:AcrR family transcriptional regulator
MKKKEKLELLYCKALEVFARYGYKKATLDDIAGEIGITKPGIYKYVKDKMDLYEKTLSYALLRWQEKVVTAVNREDDIVRKFIVMSQKGYDYLMEDQLLTEVLKKDPTIFPFSTHVVRFKRGQQSILEPYKIHPERRHPAEKIFKGGYWANKHPALFDLQNIHR